MFSGDLIQPILNDTDALEYCSNNGYVRRRLKRPWNQATATQNQASAIAFQAQTLALNKVTSLSIPHTNADLNDIILVFGYHIPATSPARTTYMSARF